MDERTLHVVTMRRWVADDFERYVPFGWRVQHSNGLDLPHLAPQDALWAPMEWAARARRSGMAPALSAISPFLLSHLPERFTGRAVTTCRLDRLLERHPRTGPVFGKLAAMKLDRLPAQWWPNVAEFVLAATDLGAPGGTLVQVCTERMTWQAEFRFFVADRQVHGGSPYLLRDGQTGAETTWFEGMAHPRRGEAARFAQSVSDWLIAGTVPRGFVLDVGWSPADGWSVVEANPAWSSATYGTPMHAVWPAVLAANDPTSPQPWEPDPWLAARAARQTPISGPRRSPH